MNDNLVIISYPFPHKGFKLMAFQVPREADFCCHTLTCIFSSHWYISSVYHYRDFDISSPVFRYTCVTKHHFLMTLMLPLLHAMSDWDAFGQMSTLNWSATLWNLTSRSDWLCQKNKLTLGRIIRWGMKTICKLVGETCRVSWILYLRNIRMFKCSVMNVFLYNTDDRRMGFMKFLLYNGGTRYLWFPCVGPSSGLLVRVCDLYKKQYIETSEISFDKKLFAMFNLEMNFKRYISLWNTKGFLWVTEKAALYDDCLLQSLITCPLFQDRAVVWACLYYSQPLERWEALGKCPSDKPKDTIVKMPKC